MPRPRGLKAWRAAGGVEGRSMKVLSVLSRNVTGPMRLSRFTASPDDVAPPSEYGPGRIASPILNVPQNEMRDSGVELYLVIVTVWTLLKAVCRAPCWHGWYRA